MRLKHIQRLFFYIFVLLTCFLFSVQPSLALADINVTSLVGLILSGVKYSDSGKLTITYHNKYSILVTAIKFNKSAKQYTTLPTIR